MNFRRQNGTQPLHTKSPHTGSAVGTNAWPSPSDCEGLSAAFYFSV